MIGEDCMTGMVVGLLARFEVDGKIYEGEVKMLSDGTMTAVCDFKPVDDELAEVFQAAVRGDKPEEKPAPFAGAVKSEVVNDSGYSQSEEASAAFLHSWKCFCADKSKSDKILDPVWLDIGVVSVATAYHPKCGKVTFLIDPCAANGTDEAGYNVTTFTRGWEFDPSNVTLSQAKALVAENWSKFCKHHEPTIKQEPEWLQVKDYIWVCEHNGWTACLVPSANLIGQYIAQAWKSNGNCEYASPVPILPLEQAKTAILAQMI